MSRRIELLRTKWFNLLIHSSRSLRKLRNVYQLWMSGSGLLGMVNRPWLEVPKEPLQEGSRLSHPCYDPCYELLMPIPQDLLYPFRARAKKELTSPIDFLHHSFGHSFFWPKRLLEKGLLLSLSLRHLDLESDRWSIHLSALPPGPAVSLPRTFFSFLTQWKETSRRWPLTSLASKWAPRWTVVSRGVLQKQ